MSQPPTPEQAAFLRLYGEADRALMRIIVESKTPGASRAEEIRHLATRAGYRHLGIAYCVGLSAEAAALERMLADRFQVTRVGCKVGGLQVGDLVPGATGTSCNPVGQAKVLADAGTELNIAVGLCLGHDILFARHSAAPVTTLVVKDRVHDHNPVAALR